MLKFGGVWLAQLLCMVSAIPWILFTTHPKVIRARAKPVLGMTSTLHWDASTPAHSQVSLKTVPAKRKGGMGKNRKTFVRALDARWCGLFCQMVGRAGGLSAVLNARKDTPACMYVLAACMCWQ